MTDATDHDGADAVRSCTRKKGYPTEDIAKLAVASIRRASPEADVRVYGCRHCGMYHVGRTPGSPVIVRDRESYDRPRRPAPRGVRTQDLYHRRRERRRHGDRYGDDAED